MQLLMLLLLPLLYSSEASPTAPVVESEFSDKEIVKVRIARSRSISGELTLSLESDNREIRSIDLKKADSILSKNFAILDSYEDLDGSTSFFDITHTVNISQIEDQMYANHDYGTYLHICGDEVEGLLSADTRIRSLSDGNHEIRKVENQDDEEYVCVEAPNPMDESEPKLQSPLKDERSSVTINPEILVLIDTEAYKMIGGTSAKLQSYLTVFWHGVHYRYKTVQKYGLTVNIKIVGWALIPTGSSFERSFLTPYIINGDKMKINGDGVLGAFGRTLYTFRNYLKYDIAYLQTGRDIYDPAAGRYSRLVRGKAYVNGACRNQNNMEYRIGIGEDTTGSYSGTHTATHEIAHLLGSHHDGSGTSSGCSAQHGYIMSSITRGTTSNRFHFSSCSASSMKIFAVHSYGSCLRIYSGAKIYPLSSNLPGQVFDADKQCASFMGSGATILSGYSGDALCVQLKCLYLRFTFTLNKPALEGTSCGNGKICRHGKCG